MNYGKFFDWARHKASNLITVRDIFFFFLGIAIAFYAAFHVYQWRMGEAKKIGAVVFENTPYIFKQTMAQ